MMGDSEFTMCWVLDGAVVYLGALLVLRNILCIFKTKTTLFTGCYALTNQMQSIINHHLGVNYDIF